MKHFHQFLLLFEPLIYPHRYSFQFHSRLPPRKSEIRIAEPMWPEIWLQKYGVQQNPMWLHISEYKLDSRNGWFWCAKLCQIFSNCKKLVCFDSALFVDLSYFFEKQRWVSSIIFVWNFIDSSTYYIIYYYIAIIWILSFTKRSAFSTRR